MSGALAAAAIVNTEFVNLSGTTGSPNTDADFEAPGTARAGWQFLATGDCVKYSGTAHNKPEWYGNPSRTTHSTPDATYYIRATDDGSGDDVPPDSGPALNTWWSLASSRTWYWEAGPGFDESDGQIKVEIATDSGGTNIIATGYYRGEATTEV